MAACLLVLAAAVPVPAGFYAGSRQSGRVAPLGANPVSPVGINISGITDWTSELPLLDVFKTSRTWIPQCLEWADPGCSSGWDTGEYALLDLDAQGWLRSLPAAADPPMYDRVATIMLLGDPRNEMDGDYLVLYDGEGTLEYGMGAARNESASRPGRDVVRFTSADGFFYLVITATDPGRTGNYLRNIHVVRAEHEFTFAGQVFDPDFLETVGRFKAVRFMDFMDTNHSTQGNWADRPRITDARYACYEPVCKGAPLELMVDLANRTDTEPWFNMPHRADDAYVRAFAAQVRDTLDPALRVYVEYSNEVWNGIFDQSDWVRAAAAAEWPALLPGSSDFERQMSWHGKRTAGICDIWDEVWGDQRGRVVCVAGGWGAIPYINEVILTCPYWSEAPCVDHGIDALAIAPYFGYYIGSPEQEAAVEGWTQQPDGGLASLFLEVTDGGLLSGEWISPDGALAESIRSMQANRALADSFGVQLFAYEGGQHLAGVGAAQNNEAITVLFTNANRDERMYAVYSDYLTGWRESGGELFMAFSLAGGYDRYGSWGALEYIRQPATPKFRALMDFIQANPCWWPGCSGAFPNLAGSGLSASKMNPGQGETVTFTLVLRNSGSAQAEGVRVSGVVPEGLVYVPGSLSASAGETDDVDAPQLEWSGAVGEVPVTLSFTAQVETSAYGMIPMRLQVESANHLPFVRSVMVFPNASLLFLPFLLR